jgi:hypothetical protein
VAGQCTSAGFLVAIDSTSTRSEGGKALRATRARCILQACEAVRKRAMTPTADRMALTGHLGGHLQIRRSIWGGGPQDQPTAKDQGLGRRVGTNKRCQTGVFLRAQGHRARNWNGHRVCPYRAEAAAPHDTSMPGILPVYVAQIYWYRIYEMDI